MSQNGWLKQSKLNEGSLDRKPEFEFAFLQIVKDELVVEERTWEFDCSHYPLGGIFQRYPELFAEVEVQ